MFEKLKYGPIYLTVTAHSISDKNNKNNNMFIQITKTLTQPLETFKFLYSQVFI